MPDLDCPPRHQPAEVLSHTPSPLAAALAAVMVTPPVAAPGPSWELQAARAQVLLGLAQSMRGPSGLVLMTGTWEDVAWSPCRDRGLRRCHRGC